jgi:hypothetical protein
MVKEHKPVSSHFAQIELPSHDTFLVSSRESSAKNLLIPAAASLLMHVLMAVIILPLTVSVPPRKTRSFYMSVDLVDNAHTMAAHRVTDPHNGTDIVPLHKSAPHSRKVMGKPKAVDMPKRNRMRKPDPIGLSKEKSKKAVVRSAVKPQPGSKRSSPASVRTSSVQTGSDTKDDHQEEEKGHRLDKENRTEAGSVNPAVGGNPAQMASNRTGPLVSKVDTPPEILEENQWPHGLFCHSSFI